MPGRLRWGNRIGLHNAFAVEEKGEREKEKEKERKHITMEEEKKSTPTFRKYACANAKMQHAEIIVLI